MSRHLILLSLPDKVDLLPGGHLVLLSKDPLACIGLRQLGLEVRDTLLVLEANRQRFGFLARRPCEGTIAENVLRYGAGSIWIDGCRVSLNGGQKTSGGCAGQTPLHGGGIQARHKEDNNLGRWPTNLVLIHGIECRPDGTRKVKAITGTLNGSWRKGHQYNGGWEGAAASELGRPIGYGDADGMEEVAAWSCVAGCPVLALNGQSGTLVSGGVADHYWKKSSSQVSQGGYGGYGDAPLTGYGDEGGASRFYPQFGNDAEFMDWVNRLLSGPKDER